MFYHIFIEYLELPKWLYTRIHYSVDNIVVTLCILLYCTTLYVFLIWLHLTISTSLGMYQKMDKWKIKIMMMMMRWLLYFYPCCVSHFIIYHSVKKIFSVIDAFEYVFQESISILPCRRKRWVWPVLK